MKVETLNRFFYATHITMLLLKRYRFSQCHHADVVKNRADRIRAAILEPNSVDFRSSQTSDHATPGRQRSGQILNSP